MAPGSVTVPIQLLYALSALMSVVLAVPLWRYRSRPGALPLLANVSSAGVWVGSLLVLSFATHPVITRMALGVLFLGVGFSTATLLAFTLSYTGHDRFLRPSVLVALSIEPLAIAGLAVVNPADLFFTVDNGRFVPQLLLWAHIAYAYVVLTVVTAMIGAFLYRSPSPYRGQGAALLVGTIAAWVANVAYIAGLVPFDTSPVGFVVTGACYVLAIVRYRLVDLLPIARNRVLDNVSDGVFVVDHGHRLVDANPAGHRLLAAVDRDPIGKHVEEICADHPDAADRYRELTAARSERERELALLGGYVHVRVTPIDDDRGRHVGWLFLVRDITERKRDELRLQRQNERLDQFADLVSHDLRNPLSVASGYLELARETDDNDEYLQQVARAHDRMETIIEDVLEVAREDGDVTDSRAVDLSTLATDAWNGVDTGDATLEIRSSATILADPRRTTRLLENLFRNCVEHSPGGTEPESSTRWSGLECDSSTGEGDGAPLAVRVGVDRTDESRGLAFYVEDDGRGIPADQRDRVFEDGYTTGGTGTGLGLSIVRQIAAAHGWSVAATEGADGGARFEFAGVERGDRADGETGADGAPNAEAVIDETETIGSLESADSSLEP